MPFIFYIFIFIFGLIIGSFLNCLIYRLPNKILLTPFIKGGSNRSFCPKCEKQIVWYDNIPVLSFIFLGGKCRECKEKISWQYPAVELATGVLFVLAFYNNFQFSIFNFQTIFNPEASGQFSIFILRSLFLISVMILIFAVDLKHYLILDIITLPAIVVLFILNLFLGFSWLNLLLAAALGGGFFLIQFLVSRGKWIGGGDIRLGFLMGIALGWPNVLVALFLAYFIGAIIGIGLVLSRKKQLASRVPMGTFLSVATVIALFWGNEILAWYLGMF